MPRYHHKPLPPKRKQAPYLKPTLLHTPEFQPQESQEYNNPLVATHSRRGGYDKGLLTGASRVPHPRVFRRYGSNTRKTVYPLPNTGILDNVYENPQLAPGSQESLFGTKQTPTLGQRGCPSVLEGIPSLCCGSGHMLFKSKV